MKEFLIFIILVFTCLNGKAINLIEKSNSNLSENAISLLKKRSTVIDKEVIKINLSELDKENAMVSIFEHNLVFTKNKINIRGINNYSYFGYCNDNTQSIILCVKDNDIQGLITIGLYIYMIETIDNQHLMLKYSQAALPDCSIGNSNSNHNKFKDSLKIVSSNNLNGQTPNILKCKLRVAALFTTDAKNAKNGGIENHIQLSIDALNLALENSDVNFEAELVFVQETSYNDGSSRADGDLALIRFQASNDGHMDAIQDARKKFAADVCLLIVNNKGHENGIATRCGVAQGIKTCKDFGFCLVDWECAVGNFSVAHEISHLMGCRHDVAVDNTNEPHEHGHGFVNSTQGFKTIMALY